jgi:hypothetical protein
MYRVPLSFSLLLAALLLAGCGKSARTTESRAVETYMPDSGSVAFDIAPLGASNGSTQWFAIYTSQGKTAKFRIDFGPEQATKTKDPKDIPISFGTGRILAESGSDSSVLLSDLAKALEAKHPPTKIKRVSFLPFTFVNIGTDLSQAPGGGFNTKPSGHWIATKIFIGEDDQEGQFFLNINPATNKGQFSIKDADYGDIVVSGLAQVL